ncbi:hypothetical protein Gotur_020259 [Gossypium turneri]
MSSFFLTEVARLLSLVTKEGKYVQSNVPRQLVYGTMVYVRQIIISEASCALSRAICISTRYSVVRRQFGRETQVLLSFGLHTLIHLYILFPTIFYMSQRLMHLMLLHLFDLFKVINYKTKQSRLFPLLASAYAFRFVGEWMKWLYTDVSKRLQANDSYINVKIL